MLKFWKREETVSRAEHERIVMGWQEDLRETHARLNRELERERATTLSVSSELAGLRADRIRYQKAAAELAIWRGHGQLRNPANGRLIPKAEAAAFTVDAGFMAALEAADCPFCGATMSRCEDSDGEFWMHPGVVTDDDCFMSGQGVFPRQLAVWNRRAALSNAPAYEAIAHGDEMHRAWLKEAITNFYAGKPVPPPVGKGTAHPPAQPQSEKMREARLAAMVAMDEELEAEHPGWMNGKIPSHQSETLPAAQDDRGSGA